MAYDFYSREFDDPQKIYTQMMGINFNRDVRIVRIPPETVLRQYQSAKSIEKGWTGNYFTDFSGQRELGILGDYLGTHNRLLSLYKTNGSVEALMSTSFDVEGWGEKGDLSGELYYGGGQQYFLSRKDIVDSVLPADPFIPKISVLESEGFQASGQSVLTATSATDVSAALAGGDGQFTDLSVVTATEADGRAGAEASELKLPAPPMSALLPPPTSIEQRTAPSDPNYWRGERIVDPQAWNQQTGLTMYRDQDNNKVLSVEGWIQPTAFPRGTSSLGNLSKDAIKGSHAGDEKMHLAHCFAKCFGGPLFGNLEPFDAAGNLAMSPLEKELRAIVDAGTSLYVQGVFHRIRPDDPAPARHEIAVYMRDRDGKPRQVGCFAVDADGTVHELPFSSTPDDTSGHVY